MLSRRLTRLETGVCLLCLLWFSASCRKAAEPPAWESPAATVYLSTNELLIGQPFKVTVLSTNTAAALRPLESLNSRGLTLVDHSSAHTDAGLSHTLTLTSFKLGAQPVFTAAVDQTAGDIPDISVFINSSLDETNATWRGLQTIHTIPPRVPRWLWLFIPALLLLAAAAYMVRRWLTKPRTIIQTPPPVPPHTRALRALQQLRNMNYIKHKEFDPFYTELSSIVRIYLEDRFQLRAPELTTEEFIRTASQSSHLSMEQQQLTGAFLERADMVKFARFQPEPADAEQALQAAEKLIHDTAQTGEADL